MHSTLRPSPDQPGTLGQQLYAAETYLRLPVAYRRRWLASAWRAARASVMPHCREPHEMDLRYMRRGEAQR